MWERGRLGIDKRGGKTTRTTQQVSYPLYDAKSLQAAGIHALDREQTCREVCEKACYPDPTVGGGMACYWSCRLHCDPGMGGDPRRQSIKKMTITIE